MPLHLLIIMYILLWYCDEIKKNLPPPPKVSNDIIQATATVMIEFIYFYVPFSGQVYSKKKSLVW